MWSYRAVKRKYEDGNIYFTVAEYFNEYGYTEDDAGLLHFDSKEDLIKGLKWMLEDITSHGVINDTERKP